MALLLPQLSCLPSSISSSSSSSSSRSAPWAELAACPSTRLWRKDLNVQRGSFNGVRIVDHSKWHQKKSLIVRASLELEGQDAGEPLPPSEGSQKPVSVENLPLESKQQMILEQKLRMKLAKKIRLRRKRLVRKRRMRKKGRWPPSKMKKLKNV